MSFSDQTIESIENDLDRLNNFTFLSEIKSRDETDELPYIQDDLYDRLCSHFISYCKENPEIERHNKNLELKR